MLSASTLSKVLEQKQISKSLICDSRFSQSVYFVLGLLDEINKFN